MRILTLFTLTISGLIISLSFKFHPAPKTAPTTCLFGLGYDYGDSVLRLPIYLSALDTLASIMYEHPGICIEIQGHTDAIEDQKLDTNLSYRRADIVRNMLITKGVDPERLIARGYSSKHLLNHCSSPQVECTPEEHAINRRVATRITKFNYSRK